MGNFYPFVFTVKVFLYNAHVLEIVLLVPICIVAPHRLYRRVYSVPGSNYLWHIDGNHKMICYRLVVHGGIDGFSRLITYLK